MRAFMAVVLATLSLAACGSSGPPAPVVTDPPAFSEISVRGSHATGATALFTLPAGAYTVHFDVLGQDGGCAFSLYLSNKPNGSMLVNIGIAFLTDASDAAGHLDFSAPAGTYVIQEDRSGTSNCTGDWDGTVDQN